MKFVKQDFLFAVRQFRKSPGFTVVAMVTLALGIGANTAFFGVINATLLRPLPYPEESQLVNLSERSTKSDSTMPVSYPDFVDWKREQTCFSALTIYRTAAPLNLKTSSGAERMSTVMVDSDFLKVMGFQPLLGRDLRPEDDLTDAAPTILLTHTTWERAFNSDSQVVGRVVDVDGRSATIVGVLPAAFDFFTNPDLVMPVGPYVNQFYLQARDSHSNARALGRLKPGVTPAAAKAEMDAVAAHLSQEYPKSNSSVGAAPMALHEYLTGAAKQRELLLMGAVGLVLLIVCVNIATLFLARASSRDREMAIRSALGADRSRLVRQVMVESLLLAATGGALGLLLARGAGHDSGIAGAIRVAAAERRALGSDGLACAGLRNGCDTGDGCRIWADAGVATGANEPERGAEGSPAGRDSATQARADAGPAGGRAGGIGSAAADYCGTDSAQPVDTGKQASGI